MGTRCQGIFLIPVPAGQQNDDILGRLRDENRHIVALRTDGVEFDEARKTTGRLDDPWALHGMAPPTRSNNVARQSLWATARFVSECASLPLLMI